MTTYVIEPTRPGRRRQWFTVDDTAQGEKFVAALSKVFGAQRVHPAATGCVDCGQPRERWDLADALYLADSDRCPGCHRADIDLDTAHARQEDQ